MQNRLRWRLHELDPEFDPPPASLDRYWILDEVETRFQSNGGLVADLARREVRRIRDITREANQLERVDLLTMGNSVEDRIRRRAGWDWESVAGSLNSGARPDHSFHVFCVYPWVGLLRSGSVDQALMVLDRCRIRWGTVEGEAVDRILLRSRPLTWDGETLRLGTEQLELVLPPAGGEMLAVGDLVAAHWDYVCAPISPGQHRYLARYHRNHLAMANATGRSLALTIES